MTEPTANIARYLSGRNIAALATHNEDGSIHMAAVWYLYENGRLYVPTSPRNRKAANARRNGNVSLMIDSRSVGNFRGVTAIGTATEIGGQEALDLNFRTYQRYLTQAFLETERIEAFQANDTVAICVAPDKWIDWDMSPHAVPGMYLPID